MRSLWFLLLSVTIAVAEPKLPPVDQSDQDKGFAAFKKELTAAVERRDARFIESILASDALASLGEDRGVASFRRTYGFEDPAAPFWRELAAVLRLGGTFNLGHHEFTAPYVASRWPDRFEPFEYVALIAKDVPVRAEPGAASEEVARLSYSILGLATGDSPGRKEWIAVNLKGGEVGYVPGGAVRSPL